MRRMQDDMHREETPPAARSMRRREGCVWLVLGILACLVCMICGGVLFAWISGKVPCFPQPGSSSSQVYVLEREKICEMAFVQQKITVDTRCEFPWNYNVPLNLGKIEIGKAEVNVKGVFLVKYGIDQAGIKLWQYYPAPRELQIS